MPQLEDASEDQIVGELLRRGHAGVVLAWIDRQGVQSLAAGLGIRAAAIAELEQQLMDAVASQDTDVDLGGFFAGDDDDNESAGWKNNPPPRG